MTARSLIIPIVVLIITFSLLSGIGITFKPFKIEFLHWRFAVGIVLIFFGSLFIYYEGLLNGQDYGVDKTIEFIQKRLNNTEEKQ